MIRILTIHHETDRFLNLQKKYIERYTEDYLVYCAHSKIDVPDLGDNYRKIDLRGVSIVHADRLNHMFNNFVKKEADDDDILIMMDSDTLPIAGNWVDVVKNNLKSNPITAIQRKENSAALLGCAPELHPHICFFATTIDFWVKNNLFIDNEPNTAFNVWRWLKSQAMDFTKILRSNAVNLHPLYFGVYGDILYHHGAGNRKAYDGVDICSRPKLNCSIELNKKFPNIINLNDKVSHLLLEEIKKDDNLIKNYFMGVK